MKKLLSILLIIFIGTLVADFAAKPAEVYVDFRFIKFQNDISTLENLEKWVNKVRSFDGMNVELLGFDRAETREITLRVSRQSPLVMAPFGLDDVFDSLPDELIGYRQAGFSSSIKAFDRDEPNLIIGYFVGMTLLLAVILELSFIFLAKSRASSVSDFLSAAFARPGTRRIAKVSGIGFGVSIIAVILAMFMPIPDEEPVLDSWVTISLILAFMVIIAPLIEELLFRVLALGIFMLRGYPKTGLILSSFAFALSHGIFAAVALSEITIAILFFFIGLVFGSVFLRTGNYWLCVVTHASYNFGVVVFATLLSTWLEG